MTKADERLTEDGRTKLFGPLDAGDPGNDVKTAWHAKDVVHQIYAHTDPSSQPSSWNDWDMASKTTPALTKSLPSAAPSS